MVMMHRGSRIMRKLTLARLIPTSIEADDAPGRGASSLR
jgi:hypothetical protein